MLRSLRATQGLRGHEKIAAALLVYRMGRERQDTGFAESGIGDQIPAVLLAYDGRVMVDFPVDDRGHGNRLAALALNERVFEARLVGEAAKLGERIAARAGARLVGQLDLSGAGL